MKTTLTDIEFLLAKMYQDHTVLGVAPFLVDAIKWQARHDDTDHAAIQILAAALAQFNVDPCGHLNSFVHLQELSDRCWG